MGSTSPHKFQPKAFFQIGILTRDARKVSEDLERLFGIGPWIINEPGSGSVAVRKATGHLGGIEIELFEPVRGKMYQSDYLDTHGEVGVHHLAFRVDDQDGELSNLLAQGAKLLGRGPGGNPYLETGGPGELIFELLKSPK